MTLLSYLSLLIALLVVYTLESTEDTCIFYYGPSSIEGTGRGIFAGITIDPYKILELCPIILIHHDFYPHWSINNYVYSFDNEYSMIVIGMAMIYNHHEILVNTNHIWEKGNEIKLSCDPNNIEPYSNCNMINYHSTKQIEIGEEIFTKFGGAEWFLKRQIPYDVLDNRNESTNRRYLDINYLSNNYFCLSNTYIDKSLIINAGNGLFARKKFVINEVVTISPVLFIPLHELIQSNSLLINYCIGSSSSGDVSILPFGVGVMINHAIKPLSNVKIQWNIYHNLTNILTTDPNELMKYNYSPIDISYIAIKPIQPNEEILLDYGNEWLTAYSNYLQVTNNKYKDYVINNMDNELSFDEFTESLPRFRYPIQPPENFFPDLWRNYHCIGENCQASNDLSEFCES